jgi:hypothetical protein
MRPNRLTLFTCPKQTFLQSRLFSVFGCIVTSLVAPRGARRSIRALVAKVPPAALVELP